MPVPSRALCRCCGRRCCLVEPTRAASAEPRAPPVPRPPPRRLAKPARSGVAYLLQTVATHLRERGEKGEGKKEEIGEKEKERMNG